ncbi:MAG: hypothetical protein SGJ00_00580 [bacterium]|nr:hypothetical protein [bacterium]
MQKSGKKSPQHVVKSNTVANFEFLAELEESELEPNNNVDFYHLLPYSYLKQDCVFNRKESNNYWEATSAQLLSHEDTQILICIFRI